MDNKPIMAATEITQVQLMPCSRRPAKRLELLDLPTEILLHILEYLTYPDALALKNASSRFRLMIIPTLTVARRVQWLIDRSDIGLPMPRWMQLNLRHDWAFTSNPEVQMMLRKRNKHEDCQVLARRHLRGIDARQPPPGATDQPTELRHDIRCTINPNVDSCIGIQQARKASSMLDDLYEKAIHVDQHYWLGMHSITSRGLHYIKISLGWIVSSILAIGSGLLYLNRLRIQMMFQIWMMTEFLIATAVVTHLVLDIEYTDMLDGVVTLIQRLHWAVTAR